MSDFSKFQSLRCDCGMTLTEEKIYQPFKLVMEGWIQIGINIFGFMANIIATIALSSKDQKFSLFNKTLFILAIFDATFNVLDILESIRILHYDRESCLDKPFYQKIHLALVPHILRPLRFFMIIASIHTTVLIAFERYLAVSKPITTFVERPRSTWKNLFQKVAPLLITSFLLTLPKCFEFYLEKICFECNASNFLIAEADSQSCSDSSGGWNTSSSTSLIDENLSDRNYYQWIHVMQWTAILNEQVYVLGYNNIALNTITYLAPVMMLFILNLLIYIHMRRRRKDIQQLGTFLV